MTRRGLAIPLLALTLSLALTPLPARAEGGTYDDWRQQAISKLGSAARANPVSRARAISAVYSQLASQDPRTLLWPGVASNTVMSYIAPLLGATHRVRATTPDAVEPGVLARVFNGAAAGNLAVYLEIASALLAYQSGGVDAVERMGPELNPQVLSAIRMIDEGKRSGNAALVLRGNQEFVSAEQKLLQGRTFGPEATAWTWLTPLFRTAAFFGAMPASPVPDRDVPLPSGFDFASLEDRVEWGFRLMAAQFEHLVAGGVSGSVRTPAPAPSSSDSSRLPFLPPGGPGGPGGGGALVAPALGTSDDSGEEEGPGGIDLSTLELRYLSEPPGDRSLAFAFRAAAEGGDGGVMTTAGAAALTASDLFFTFLAVDPATLVVDLQPGHDVIDRALEGTEVGRILAESDLALKKAIGRILNPETLLGQQYWDRLGASTPGSASVCVPSRAWITAAPASVWEDDNAMYVVDAPLQVHYAQDVSLDAVGGERCEAAGPSVLARANEAFTALVLPTLTAQVNGTDPAFAPLRQLYFARVAAEWYRARRPHGVFSSLIGSGHAAERWPSQARWDPADVYARFIDSLSGGEWRSEQVEVHGGQSYLRVLGFGGIDLREQPMVPATSAELLAAHPSVEDDLAMSLDKPGGAVLEDGRWVGGVYVAPAAVDQLIPAPSDAATPGDTTGPEGSSGRGPHVPAAVLVGVLAVTAGAIGVVLLVGRSRRARWQVSWRGGPRLRR